MFQNFGDAELYVGEQNSSSLSTTDVFHLRSFFIPRANDDERLPMRSKRSSATVSKARLIMGYSSSTSLKLSTDSEYSRQ